jgi:hypothetical protein
MARPAISKGPRGKIQTATPGRAIPENEREERGFLFSTAIADILARKEPSGSAVGLYGF